MRWAHLVWLASGAIATVSSCMLDRSGSRDDGGGGSGVPDACALAPDCGDDSRCTTDVCSVGRCASTPDDALVPDDHDACTADTCAAGVERHIPVPTGTPCGMAGKLACNGAGHCAGCSTDADCGAPGMCWTANCAAGTCSYANAPPGEVGMQTPGDCRSIRCDKTGNVVTMTDKTDVPSPPECSVGGCDGANPTSSPAMEGTKCDGGAKVCDGKGSCVVCTQSFGCPMGAMCINGACASCSDGVLNGGETAIDCGGACPKCNGDPCGQGADCKSGACVDGICCDGACGGPCTACTTALTGAPNGTCAPVAAGTDPKGQCATLGNCGANGKCACGDGIIDGTEAGIDCGGACPQKCGQGSPCHGDGDCLSGSCADGVCCNVDCGTQCYACNLPGRAGTCSLVAGGWDDPQSTQPCGGNSTCDNKGSCVAKAKQGQGCDQGSDCASGRCSGFGACLQAGGTPCNNGLDCYSVVCINHTCL